MYLRNLFLSIVFVSMVMLTFAPISFAQAPPASVVPDATSETAAEQQEPTIDDLLAQAEKLYRSRSNVAKAREAIKIWEQILAGDANNKKALAMLGRALWWVGINSPSEQDKLNIHQKGIDYCKRLLQLDPNSVEGNYWIAVNYGKLGQVKGVMNSLSMIPTVKDHLAIVARTNKRYEGGGYYRITGSIQLKVPRLLGGGTTEQAIESYREAVKIAPKKLWNHLYLAKAYLKDGEDDPARQELEWIVSAPNEPGYYAESVLNRAEAKRLLAEHFQ
jgi:tetratricopeptide (TPR) repeat protein